MFVCVLINPQHKQNRSVGTFVNVPFNPLRTCMFCLSFDTCGLRDPVAPALVDSHLCGWVCPIVVQTLRKHADTQTNTQIRTRIFSVCIGQLRCTRLHCTHVKYLNVKHIQWVADVMLQKSYLFENYSLSNSEQMNISFVMNMNLNNEKKSKVVYGRIRVFLFF